MALAHRWRNDERRNKLGKQLVSERGAVNIFTIKYNCKSTCVSLYSYI